MSIHRDWRTNKNTSSLLSEHARVLNKLSESKELKMKPALDEQQVNENKLMLEYAILNNLFVIIKYFSDSEFYSAMGKINRIDVPNKKIVLEDQRNTAISFEQVVEVYID